MIRLARDCGDLDLATLTPTEAHPRGSKDFVYSLGTFTFDAATFIIFNHASASGDNMGP
ncbi:MAG TPA: hypothetical protein VK395_14055 [Gemmataceae bacterium]|nr:hypothetical protein [Gemmataceae bacterium]